MRGFLEVAQVLSSLYQTDVPVESYRTTLSFGASQDSRRQKYETSTSNQVAVGETSCHPIRQTSAFSRRKVEDRLDRQDITTRRIKNIGRLPPKACFGEFSN